MKILPRSEFFGEFAVPGDKSITHRAVMLNAAAEGEALITGALTGEDCLSTVSCMRALGAKIERDGDRIRVVGAPAFADGQTLYCGNSGTTMRLLAGLLAGRNVRAVLTGDPSLSKRPMERVAAPLRLLGAEVRTQSGFAPVEIGPAALKGCAIQTEVASAQVKSAVILAALGAEGETAVSEKLKTRDHTERMLGAMGAQIELDGNTVRVRKSRLHAADVAVPADISSAAYFMVLGALLGETLVRNVGINPTRTGIFTVFDRMGVSYALEGERTVCGEPVADVRVKKSALRPLRLKREDMPSLIDEIPVIAVLCAFADGESVISGAEELRVKESDRIATTAEMLAAVGASVTAKEDGFVIRGKKKIAGADVDPRLDHRIAMSAAVALCASERGGEIKDAACADISFPNFYSLLG